VTVQQDTAIAILLGKNCLIDDGALQSPLATKECRSSEVAAGHGGCTVQVSQCADDASQPLGCTGEQRAAAEIQ
jgi:hypothetical protein